MHEECGETQEKEQKSLMLVVVEWNVSKGSKLPILKSQEETETKSCREDKTECSRRNLVRGNRPKELWRFPKQRRGSSLVKER